MTNRNSILVNAKEPRGGAASRSSLYDLHVHSVSSDGLFTLPKLVEMARRSRLAGFALTDHDCVPACLKDHDIDVRAGVELSVRGANRSLHLLGYGFDRSDIKLHALCAQLQEWRRNRVVEILSWLESRSVRLSASAMERVQRLVIPGRRHLARELVAEGEASSYSAAFQGPLGQLPPTVSSSWCSLEHAIGIVQGARGIAVLAHPPARMTKEEWRQCVDAGIDGIEARHPSFSKSHQRFLAERVREYSLIATAGSDFHGDDPREILGVPSCPLCFTSQQPVD